jgi:hypothetical protein
VGASPAEGDLQCRVQGIKGDLGRAGEGAHHGGVRDVARGEVELEDIVLAVAGGFVECSACRLAGLE